MTESIRKSWQEILTQTQTLLEDGLHHALVQSIRASLHLGISLHEFEMLFQLLQTKSIITWLELPNAVVVYSDLMLKTRRFDEALNFIRTRVTKDERLLVFQALALLRTNQPVEAFNTIEQVVTFEHQTGVWWRVKAEIMYSLGLPDWQAAFAQASQKLTERPLGLCLIEWGVALERDLRHAQARECWTQALVILEKDRYYQAVTTYNLGLSCARELKLQEAEDYFAKLEKFSRHKAVRMFETRAWSGFGLAWRAVGEFTRAEHAYQKATRCAIEPEDKRQAWVGLGHTLRLAGQTSSALTALRHALGIENQAVSRVYVDLAVAQYANGNAQSALISLEKTGQLFGEDLERKHLLLAEMARIQGDANSALETIQKVRLHSLWAREELQAFPGLKTLLLAMEQTIPEALPRVTRLKVEVFARGALRVRVNGRNINLAPTSRAAEILVLLLEHENQRSMLKLIADLFGEQSRDALNPKRKLISKAIRQLKDALGWEGSVIEGAGLYRLDTEQTQWTYDIAQAVFSAPARPPHGG